MRVRIFPDVQRAAVYAAAIVEYIIQTNPAPVLGLATGSTPLPLYQQLIEFHRAGLSFAHVTTINLDEYVGISGRHRKSYQTYMAENLFASIDIVPEQTFLPQGDASDLSAACRSYDEIIRNHPIDLQVLGIGVNGHIGFNEPGVALKATTHVVQLSEETIRSNARFFDHADEVPTQAITMGLQPIVRAGQVLLMAFGAEKAAAVKMALEGDVSTSLPASILQIHPNVTFILDQAAARYCL